MTMTRGIRGETHDAPPERIVVRGVWRVRKVSRFEAMYWYDHPTSFFSFQAEVEARRESSRDTCGFWLTVYAKPAFLLGDGAGASQGNWCRVEPPDDFFDNNTNNIGALERLFQRKIVEEAKRFLKRQAAIL